MKWLNQKHNSNNIFEKIEQEVQNDLAMFLEFGEEYFSVEELEMLYNQWEKEFYTTDTWRGRFLILCTGSFMLLPLIGMLNMFDFKFFIPLFLFAFPILFLAGIGGFVGLYFRYGKQTDQEAIGRKLKSALRNKRKRSNFPKDFKN